MDRQSHIWNMVFLACNLMDKIFQNVSLLEGKLMKGLKPLT